MSWHYFYVFFQSNGLEVLFLLWFYRWYQKQGGLSLKKIGLVVTLANSITHPVVIFLILKGPFTYLGGVLIAESFAVIGEVFLHRRYLGVSFKKAFLGSLIANLISWQMGAAMTTYFFLQKYLT